MKKLGKRGIVILVLAAVLLVSGGMVVRRLVEYRLGDQEYEEAQELVQLPDLDALPQPDESQEPQEEQPVYVDPYADALAAMDFSALREVNSDVLGWILIPGTNLSYPLLQGDDNQYYLNHTWRKSYNSVGAIFMECRNSADLSLQHHHLWSPHEQPLHVRHSPPVHQPELLEISPLHLHYR